MSQRTHEFMLSGDAQSYDRLGFRYTEGEAFATFYHPDSQHSEQTTTVPYAEIKALRDFLGELINPMAAAIGPEELKKGGS